MSIYMNRPLGYKRGMMAPTTAEQVRTALDDDAQRGALLQRTNRTVSAMRTLTGRDAHEMAYALAMMENEIDAFSGYLDLTALAHWTAAAITILRVQPQVREFIDGGDRAIIGGWPHVPLSPEKAGGA